MYNRHKQEVDEIFDDIPEGIRVRSRCQWYEKREKPNKFFPKREIQGKVRKIIINEKEIPDEKHINSETELFITTCLNKMKRNLLFSTQHFRIHSRYLY